MGRDRVRVFLRHLLQSWFSERAQKNLAIKLSGHVADFMKYTYQPLLPISPHLSKIKITLILILILKPSGKSKKLGVYWGFLGIHFTSSLIQ